MRHVMTFGAALCLGACATATRGMHEVLRIESVPAGATAISDVPLPSGRAEQVPGGRFYACAPTPCGIDLPRRSDPVVTVSLAGHQPIAFKVVSSHETPNVAVPTGAIVAGLPPGSHVRAGAPSVLKRIPVKGGSIMTGLMTMGAGTVVDAASGAYLSLAPNPVTVTLAPLILGEGDAETAQDAPTAGGAR